MSEPYACSKCGKPTDGQPFYRLLYDNVISRFCSRRCLVEFIAPEITKAVVVTQWVDAPIPIGHTKPVLDRFVPTPEESERMSQ